MLRGKKILAKVAKISIYSRANFKNDIIKIKSAASTFWATFGKNGLLFIPTSGHTAVATLSQV